jgi:2',3'-cyclic-nucleotide 2'-phosphodiesterase (5'-nucleotidase family)
MTLLSFSVSFFGLMAGLLSQRSQAQQAVNITFLHVNDHHSHLDEHNLELLDENIPLGLSVETSSLRVYYGMYFPTEANECILSVTTRLTIISIRFSVSGGASRMNALIQSLSEEATSADEEVFVLHAGDAITGTLYYSFFGSEPDAKMMNAVGFDAFVVGNHEFDDGDAQLANFIRLLEMPVLSYNSKLVFFSVRCKLIMKAWQQFLSQTIVIVAFT